MDRDKAIKAVKDFLEALGQDTSSEGLKDTPRRGADAFSEFCEGYDKDAAGILSKTFAVDEAGLVIEKDIFFSSTCEHHLMPFFGTVAIAYIPQGKVAGLSKLARCVDVFAKRLQLQERMTKEIANAIYKYLSPKGVMVMVEAEHTCMTLRGVKKPGTKTSSSYVLGDFPEECRREFLSCVKGR